MMDMGGTTPTHVMLTQYPQGLKRDVEDTMMLWWRNLVDAPP